MKSVILLFIYYAISDSGAAKLNKVETHIENMRGNTEVILK